MQGPPQNETPVATPSVVPARPSVILFVLTVLALFVLLGVVCFGILFVPAFGHIWWTFGAISAIVAWLIFVAACVACYRDHFAPGAVEGEVARLDAEHTALMRRYADLPTPLAKEKAKKPRLRYNFHASA